ncbi:aminotransferase class I/II-fold pyridoxal phosphate-dependent enzyme [Microvirga sp. VF16]|uniref:aminotransferase class I/II-fold pyridoxal phosphate-dependent enzyme n=1 Tax=Microvirga sp. VF16 TaxID=2807101 RepID=UPI00193D1D82|nr:aminotransferase class I/II-fold pyridoxal phosphate-dependent enzyme [Microvirga sp. VF16]QRM32338.1 aminotransferase class I/II-fold pyridoxal phosphate-dependent enzyme [Microvirga sp. VF16]
MSAHDAALAALHRRGRLRRLVPCRGIDFTSNDYLGLAESQALRQAAAAALARGVPVGAGGSRLLRGNHAEHEALEAEAAAFFGAESALFFAGGFAANAALVATLPRRGDLVVHDELIHASVHEGLMASPAEAVAVPHNDAGAVNDAISRWRATGGRGRPWIAAETLYGMDGDVAPLADLLTVADRHDAMLLLDEAHATGVCGPAGRGFAAALEGRSNVVTLHTCGKALGVMGALVCLPQTLRAYMVNRARGFIYATAPSPLLAALVRAALGLVATADDRRQRLAALVAHARRRLAAIGLPATTTQIQPVIVGADRRATALAAALQAQGFDLRAIRPPTVPPGTARLRIALTLNVNEAAVDALVAVLADELARQRT